MRVTDERVLRERPPLAPAGRFHAGVLRCAAALAIAAAFVAACGDSSDGGSSGQTAASPNAPSPSPSASPPPGEPAPPPTPPTAGAQTATYEVWFVRGGKLFSTARTGGTTEAVATRALQAVAAGPSAAESGAGVRSVVPAGTRFTIKGIANGVATLDTDAAFRSGEGPQRRLREAQVVYTLTQYRTVRRVLFSGTAKPVGRGTYEDLVPPITVAAPHIGQRVGSPVRIAGTANVFEATVSMRILDARGKELTKAFTTATCGSGCRGDYKTSLPYEVAEDQPGVIEVYENSAADGSRIHVVSIPVTLTKSG